MADQQGNVRVSFQEQGTTGVAVVKQENSYYPFGLIMPNSQIAIPGTPNKKLYNGGSEWQNDYGDLPDLYQTYYRSYDAALGRFTGIDPKAEVTDALSPYHYAGNNHVLYWYR
ncbi:MAG: RHS repeat-associated core domain-containing protein [Bacteroidota bacterium]